MEIGPVEYLLISFPGNQFRGEIAPAIANLVEGGTIRILDLTFIIKAADGSTAMFEYDELPEAAGFVDIEGEADSLFSDEDLELAAEALEPNSSALFILWEDTWATELADAIRGAGGQILAGQRIPRDIVEAAFVGIEEAAS